MVIDLGIKRSLHTDRSAAGACRYKVDADVSMQVMRNIYFDHWATDSNKLFEYTMARVRTIRGV